MRGDEVLKSCPNEYVPGTTRKESISRNKWMRETCRLMYGMLDKNELGNRSCQKS